MTPEQIQALIEAASKGTSGFSKQLSDLGTVYKATAATDRLASENFRKGLDALSVTLKTRTNPGMGQFVLNLTKGNRQFESMESQIKELNEAISDTTDLTAKNALTSKRDELLKQEASNRARFDTGQSTAKFGKVLTDGATTAARGLITGLQSGASATQLSSGLMSAGVDVLTGTVSAVGSGLSMVGTAATTIAPMLVKSGGYAAALGISLQALGAVVNFASGTANKLAKFGIEVLSKEVEKTVTAFNTMSASGAIFANGMMGMRDAAGGAGLTVDQFSKVVQANSRILGESGLGVAEGAAAVGRVGKIFDSNGGKIRTEMMKMGFGFEEQAELTAQTIANMRRSTGGASSDSAVAEQTQKYAENLRTIAQITGEDAKAKVKQVEEQNKILAFQQYLASRTPEQRGAITAAMATMSEQTQKNLRDRAIFGQVINQEGAIAESTNEALRARNEAAFADLQNNVLTAESNAALNASYGDAIKDNIIAQTALGIAAYAASGTLGAVASGLLEEVNIAIKYTADSVKAQAEDRAKVKGTTETLTNDLTRAAAAAQAMATAFQELLKGPLADYASVTTSIISTMRDLIADSTGASPGSFSSRMESAKTGALGVGMAGAGVGGVVGGATTFGVGAAPGALLGATVGGVVGGVSGFLKPELDALGKTITGWFGSKEGKATGGVSSGPTTGYLEKLHGTEAVIPTVGGKVPIELRGDELAQGGGPGAGALSIEYQASMLKMMSQFIVSMDTLNSRMDDQIRQTEKLVVAAS